MDVRIQEFDERLFRLINGTWVNPVFDLFFSSITDFGYSAIPLIILGMIALYFANPRMRYLIVLMVLAVLVADMVGQDIKTLVGRLRPYLALENARLPSGGGRSRSFSFPSNHAINMFAATTIFAWEFRRKGWLSLFLYIPAILIAWSRVYVGDHYPTDVIGGAAIGLACSALILTVDHFFPFLSVSKETGKVILNWTGLTILLLIFASAYRYSVIAREVLPLATEECQYWDWSRHLDFSYYSKPPGIAYIIRFFTEIFGTSAFSIRCAAVSMSAGIGIITIFFTRELFHDARVTFFTIFTMNVAPLFAIGAIIMTTDTPMMFFWAAASYAMYLAIARERRIYWYIAGVMFGFGLLSKYAMIYFPVCLAVFFLVSRAHRFWLRRPEPYLFLLIGLIMFSPVLIWSWQHDWINFRHVAGQANMSGGFALTPGKFIAYIFGQMAAITPLIFCAMIYFTITAVRGPDWSADIRTKYLLSMGVPVYLMLLVKSLQGPVLDNWAAPAYYTWIIFAVWQFSRFLDRAESPKSWRRRVGYAGGALAIPLLVFLLFHDRTVFRAFQRFTVAATDRIGLVIDPAKIDPAYTMTGYDKLGDFVSKIMSKPSVVLRPGRTFIFTKTYQIAASQAFYVKGHPRVYTVDFGDGRMNQYDVWGPPGKSLEGWDALFITKGNGDRLGKEITSSFQSYEKLAPIVSKWDRIRYREFTVYVCKGFTGEFPFAVDHPGKF